MVVEKDLESRRAVGRGVDAAKTRETAILSIEGRRGIYTQSWTSVSRKA